MVKTIAVSKSTYTELVKIKEEYDTSSMDEALKRLMADYRTLLKRLSIRRLFSLNKKNNKITVDQLLEDRRRYGWPRKLY
jgi:predicted CopG family antitoxin